MCATESPVAGEKTDGDCLREPWDMEANKIQNETGADLAMCRDSVILDFLHNSGDAKPLIDWARRDNHIPSIEVIRYLAEMLAEDPSDERIIYFLRPKKRNGRRGPIPKQLVSLKEARIADYIQREIDEHGNYDAAIAKVTELDGITNGAARAAYTKRKKGEV